MSSKCSVCKNEFYSRISTHHTCKPCHKKSKYTLDKSYKPDINYDEDEDYEECSKYISKQTYLKITSKR